jgi:hypothetical protein
MLNQAEGIKSILEFSVVSPDNEFSSAIAVTVVAYGAGDLKTSPTLPSTLTPISARRR